MNKLIKIVLFIDKNENKNWEISFCDNEFQQKIYKEYNWIENNIQLGKMLSCFINPEKGKIFNYDWKKFNIIEIDVFLPWLLKKEYSNFSIVSRENKNFLLVE